MKSKCLIFLKYAIYFCVVNVVLFEVANLFALCFSISHCCHNVVIHDMELASVTIKSCSWIYIVTCLAWSSFWFNSDDIWTVDIIFTKLIIWIICEYNFNTAISKSGFNRCWFISFNWVFYNSIRYFSASRKFLYCYSCIFFCVIYIRMTSIRCNSIYKCNNFTCGPISCRCCDSFWIRVYIKYLSIFTGFRIKFSKLTHPIKLIASVKWFAILNINIVFIYCFT